MKIVKIVIVILALLSMGKFASSKNFPHTLRYTQTIGTVVTSTTNKLVKIYAGAEELMATPEHPIYESTNGWTLAGSLRKGMSLLLATGLSLSIDSVAAIDTTCTVYNCDVPLTHTYFVGSNAILAHNADVCNKLVVTVMNKLNKGYDDVKVALGEVLEEYAKVIKTKKEADAIEELSKLVSENISNTQLKNFISYVGGTEAKAKQFALDINQYSFMDDLAKDGALLDNYKAIKSGDYTNYKNLIGDIKKAYPKYHSFWSNSSYFVKNKTELLSFVTQKAIRADIDLDFVIRITQGRRDLIEGMLLSTKEVVEGKTLSELFQHFNIPNIPAASSLSNYQVRIWYKITKSKIGNIIDKTKSLESQAKEAFNLRNTYRTNARNYMNDKNLADYLRQNEVNQEWMSLVKRTEEKLKAESVDILNKDNVWNRIIQDSMSGREDVDKLFKLYDL